MKQFAFPVGFTSLDAAVALFGERDFVWLDSNRAEHPLNRYSYIAFNPSQHIELSTSDDLPPFQGGYMGYRTYEGEDHFKFYSQILAFDHLKGEAWFIHHCEGETEAHAAYNKVCTKVRNARPLPTYKPTPPEWVSNFTEAAYEDAVADIITRILNGDIFQANLTHCFTAEKPLAFHGFYHYLRLREINPAPFSAYIHFGEVKILSASPESFLNVKKDGGIVTQPIKGTDANAEKLMASVKDRAENTMIVDLLRNDLSQVCKDQSVSVDKLCELQSFAGLHHLVSRISGELQEGITPQEALDACFPGGSITGAPKIEAMKILAEIEKIPRHIYCGAIGWIGMDGAMEMNIAIRTLVVQKDRLSFGVGGGITALSNPVAEYQETLLKAQKIFKSFEGGGA